MKNKMESMTMQEVLDALNTAVNTYNDSFDVSVRAEAEKTAKACTNKYNEMAKLTAYAHAIKDNGNELVNIIKCHHYDTKSVSYKPVESLTTDGRTVIKKMGAVKDGTKNIDMFDFLVWAESRNKKIAANPGWKAVMNVQREALAKKFNEAADSSEAYTISKTFANNTLQAVFDALVFIASETGKNAVFPNKDCKLLVIACAAEYKETVTKSGDVDCSLEFLTAKKWQTLVQSAMFLVLKNKELKITFGAPEEDADSKEVEGESKPETNSEEASK